MQMNTNPRHRRTNHVDFAWLVCDLPGEILDALRHSPRYVGDLPTHMVDLQSVLFTAGSELGCSLTARNPSDPGLQIAEVVINTLGTRVSRPTLLVVVPSRWKELVRLMGHGPTVGRYRTEGHDKRMDIEAFQAESKDVQDYVLFLENQLAEKNRRITELEILNYRLRTESTKE
jgi:hypothetical protein